MKKSLVTVVLLFAMVAFAVAQAPAGDPQQGAAGAQATPQGAQAGTAPAGAQDPAQAGAAPQQQKKEIKDQAEYQAYISAIQQQDPNAKASQLEGFIQQYPQSVVRTDALEALMGAYQQLQNIPKLEQTAGLVLQAEPNHVPALALMSLLRRQTAQQNQDAKALAEARDYAQRGLQALNTWQKPEAVPADQFAKQKNDLASLFNGTIGLANFQEKNYTAAIQPLRAALQAAPNDFTLAYSLGVSYLEARPKTQQNELQGIFFATRAAALAPPQQPQLQKQVLDYVRRRYAVYHGGEDGFENVMKYAQTNPMPGPDFTIQPGPTPQEQAAKMAAKPAAQLSFDEIQFILQNGTPADRDRVWGAIQGKPIAFQAKVIEATPDQLRVAATYDNIQNNVADVTITMADAIPAKMVPKPGTTGAVTGTPSAYTAEPFMITMTAGKLAVVKGTGPAAGTKAGAPAKPGAKKGAAKGRKR